MTGIETVAAELRSADWIFEIVHDGRIESAEHSSAATASPCG